MCSGRWLPVSAAMSSVSEAWHPGSRCWANARGSVFAATMSRTILNPVSPFDVTDHGRPLKVHFQQRLLHALDMGGRVMGWRATRVPRTRAGRGGRLTPAPVVLTGAHAVDAIADPRTVAYRIPSARPTRPNVKTGGARAVRKDREKPSAE